MTIPRFKVFDPLSQGCYEIRKDLDVNHPVSTHERVAMQSNLMAAQNQTRRRRGTPEKWQDKQKLSDLMTLFFLMQHRGAAGEGNLAQYLCVRYRAGVRKVCKYCGLNSDEIQ